MLVTEIDASHRMMQVTERELQRILLDIHDGPVQHMYAALSQLDLLRRAVEARRWTPPRCASGWSASACCWRAG